MGELVPPFIVLRFRTSGAPRLRWRRVKALCRNGRLAARARACRTCRVVGLGRRRLPRVVVAGALTAWPLVGRCFAQPVASTGRAAALSPIETWADLTETRLSRTGRGLGPVASNGRGQRRLRSHASKMSDLAIARDSAPAHLAVPQVRRGPRLPVLPRRCPVTAPTAAARVRGRNGMAALRTCPERNPRPGHPGPASPHRSVIQDRI